jgi:hypothetical protein
MDIDRDCLAGGRRPRGGRHCCHPNGHEKAHSYKAIAHSPHSNPLPPSFPQPLTQDLLLATLPRSLSSSQSETTSTHTITTNLSYPSSPLGSSPLPLILLPPLLLLPLCVTSLVHLILPYPQLCSHIWILNTKLYRPLLLPAPMPSLILPLAWILMTPHKPSTLQQILVVVTLLQCVAPFL